jgi:hypothetical protein
MMDQVRMGAALEPAPLTNKPNAIPAPRRIGCDDPRNRVLTTRTGLRIPADLAFDDWERAGRQLSGIVDSSSWWLGDWLVYGKDHYVDRYQRGIRAAGLQYQTLRNYAWVARRFEPHRRRNSLTFQHHAELASLPPDDQEVWLDRTEQMRWSTKQLRDALRLARRGMSTAPLQPGIGRMTERLAVPGNRLQWWHQAAQRSGVDLEQWVLTTLDQAAEQALVEGADQSVELSA